ncbi:hypothetical protein NKG05_15545 [Oerskovia sp. M15]
MVDAERALFGGTFASPEVLWGGRRRGHVRRGPVGGHPPDPEVGVSRMSRVTFDVGVSLDGFLAGRTSPREPARRAR